MNGIEQVKKPTGQIGMILHKGGEYDKETGTIVGAEEIIAEKEVKNLIVNKASELMAARLAPGAKTGAASGGSIGGEFATAEEGLQFLAVGVGILKFPNLPYDKVTNPVDTAEWELQNPKPEQLTDSKLRGEIFRKAFTSWSFVSSDGADSSQTTNVLKVVTTFYESEAVGPLTEMGLFGGNALNWSAGGKDTGYMFNYKTFPVWNKPGDARLTITWKLTF